MLLDHYFDGSWNYGSQSFTHAFISKEVKNNHGPLGALYPQSYVSEWDSPASLWAIKNGLRNYENPTYGGWGGRFYRVGGFENVYADVSVGSYARWIEEPCTIHVILEVKDRGKPSLFSYQRMIITVIP